MGRKVTVIGAGKVGATTAHMIALKGLADVVLVNRTAGIAEGVALDIKESLPIEMLNIKVTGSGDYSQIADSDIVVITAGVPRKEGMSRDELLKTNSDIVSAAAKEIALRAPNSIIIVVSNPLDAMAHVAKKVTGFDKSRVIGMAGALDSARFSAFIAEDLKESVKVVQTMILGSHGDSMVPIISATTVRGVQLSGLMNKDRISQIVARARDGGAEIIKLEGSSAYYAPAAAVVSMVDSILNDKKKTIPCSVYAEGEYGINGIFIGLPAVLGKSGVEEIVKIPLDETEKAGLSESAAKIADLISHLP